MVGGVPTSSVAGVVDERVVRGDFDNSDSAVSGLHKLDILSTLSRGRREGTF